MTSTLRNNGSAADRKRLLSELDKFGQRKRTHDQQMLERFLRCPTLRSVSSNADLLTKTRAGSANNLPLPSALLPWLH